jgi:hypothetical protein
MLRHVFRTDFIAAAGCALSWLVLSGHSPLSHRMASMPLATNLASAVNLPTMLFAMTGWPGARAPTGGAVALVAAMQWLAYGAVLGWLWHKLRPGNAPRAKPVRART